jgi:hypothetical protein
MVEGADEEEPTEERRPFDEKAEGCNGESDFPTGPENIGEGITRRVALLERAQTRIRV